MDSAFHWIPDSGSSRHLVKTAWQLHDVEDFDKECMFPNGESMRMQLQGSAKFMACVDGAVSQVKLVEVYQAENLLWNLISYEKVEGMG